MPTDPKALGKLLSKMEAEMLEHARNLEFEEAARLRDEIRRLEGQELELTAAGRSSGGFAGRIALV